MRLHPLGLIGAIWGVVGVFLLVGSAVYRLTPVALSAFDHQLLWYHWVVFAIWMIFMIHGEGYKGFQKGFSPRVAARARYLASNPTPLRVLLAPAFCIGFFGAVKKRVIVSWCVFTGILGLILLVRMLEQPWRGIIDCGVVAGLSWGLVALLIFVGHMLMGKTINHAHEVNE